MASAGGRVLGVGVGGFGVVEGTMLEGKLELRD